MSLNVNDISVSIFASRYVSFAAAEAILECIHRPVVLEGIIQYDWLWCENIIILIAQQCCPVYRRGWKSIPKPKRCRSPKQCVKWRHSGKTASDFRLRPFRLQVEQVVQLCGQMTVGCNAPQRRELLINTCLLEKKEELSAVVTGYQIINAEILLQFLYGMNQSAVHHHGASAPFWLHHSKWISNKTNQTVPDIIFIQEPFGIAFSDFILP